MKKIVFVLLFLLIVVNKSNGQDYYINFDSFDQDFNLHFYLDTINSNNDWQIGKPNKTNFNSAYSLPNVIITDTLSSYKVNDTSIFYLTHRREFGDAMGLYLEFQYKIESDSLNDFGFVEYSINGGQDWINLTDTLYKIGYISSPVFTGTSLNWQYAHLFTGQFV